LKSNLNPSCSSLPACPRRLARHVIREVKFHTHPKPQAWKAAGSEHTNIAVCDRANTAVRVRAIAGISFRCTHSNFAAPSLAGVLFVGSFDITTVVSCITQSHALSPLSSQQFYAASHAAGPSYQTTVSLGREASRSISACFGYLLSAFF